MTAGRGKSQRVEGVERSAVDWDLAEAIGGVRGSIDSGLASTVFVLVYTFDGRRLTPALLAALGATLLLLVVRLVRREPLRQAASGVLGVAISAVIASMTGRAANFFVVGIGIQIAYAVAYLVSLTLRWPLLGIMIGPLTGEGMAWRNDPPRRRAYWWASWIWFFVFVIRTAVQLPLYLRNEVVTLGLVKIAMGWPMFALAGLASWLILRRVPPTLPAAGPLADASADVAGAADAPEGTVDVELSPGAGGG